MPVQPIPGAEPGRDGRAREGGDGRHGVVRPPGGSARPGAPPAPLSAVLAFPLLFVGLSALAGALHGGPRDDSPVIGVLIGCALIAPAVLLLRPAAHTWQRSSLGTAVARHAGAGRLGLAGCFALAAVPLIAAARSDGVPPAPVVLAGALALEAGLLMLLVGVASARR